MLVQLFPLGYAIGKYLPEDERELQKRIDKYFAVLDRGATTKILFCQMDMIKCQFSKIYLQSWIS